MPYLLLFAFINYANFALEVTINAEDKNNKKSPELSQDSYKIRDSINNLPNVDKQNLMEENETNVCLMPSKLVEKNELDKLLSLQSINILAAKATKKIDYEYICRSINYLYNDNYNKHYNNEEEKIKNIHITFNKCSHLIYNLL